MLSMTQTADLPEAGSRYALVRGPWRVYDSHVFADRLGNFAIRAKVQNRGKEPDDAVLTLHLLPLRKTGPMVKLIGFTPLVIPHAQLAEEVIFYSEVPYVNPSYGFKITGLVVEM